MKVTLKDFLIEQAKLGVDVPHIFEDMGPDIMDEGFFGDLKNKLSGAVEYNTANNYAGSPEAQAFVTKDRRSKVQIDTLIKKGMTPEEAKAAVMYVFDKSDKNPLGFVGKNTVYDPQTKTLKVSSTGGMNPSLGSL